MSASKMADIFPGLECSQAKKIKEKDPRFSCIFCHRADIDDLKLGPLYLYEGIVTHYFCMLFSAGLSQHGNDKEGILGFLVDDILKEVGRGKRLKCIYCHTTSATVGCCVSRCQAMFHFPCGLEHDAQFQFFGNYESFCKNHTRLPQRKLENGEFNCPICFSMIYDADKPVFGSCCKSAIFHKECIQKLALSAGYFFKCPTCNSQGSFIIEMKSQGVFVPEQDAAWELEPNAFQELLEQYNHCDAKECECPKGREYGASKGSWLLARCRICGAAGTHRQCGKLSTIANWACAPCLEVEVRTDAERKANGVIKEKEKAAPPPKPRARSARGPGSVSASTLARLARTMNGDDVNLNQVLITPCCREYFPHDKQAVQHFARRNKGLPDWRNFELRVNLVDIFAPALPEKIDKSKKKAEVSKAATTTTTSTSSSSETQNVYSSSSRSRKSIKKSSKKTRGSSWQNGIVRKKIRHPPKDIKKKISADQVNGGGGEGEVKDDDAVFKKPYDVPKKKMPVPEDSSASTDTTTTSTGLPDNANDSQETDPTANANQPQVPKEKEKPAAQTMAILAGLRWVSLNSEKTSANGTEIIEEGGATVSVDESKKRKLEPDDVDEDGDKNNQSQKRPFQVLLATNNNQTNSAK